MKYQILIFILYFSVLSNAQTKLDKLCFLIGTIDEYSGRYKDPLDDEMITVYNYDEKDLLLNSYKLFKSDYPDLKIDSLQVRY